MLSDREKTGPKIGLCHSAALGNPAYYKVNAFSYVYSADLACRYFIKCTHQCECTLHIFPKAHFQAKKKNANHLKKDMKSVPANEGEST